MQTTKIDYENLSVKNIGTIGHTPVEGSSGATGMMRIYEALSNGKDSAAMQRIIVDESLKEEIVESLKEEPLAVIDSIQPDIPVDLSSRLAGGWKRGEMAIIGSHNYRMSSGKSSLTSLAAMALMASQAKVAQAQNPNETPELSQLQIESHRKFIDSIHEQSVKKVKEVPPKYVSGKSRAREAKRLRREQNVQSRKEDI